MMGVERRSHRSDPCLRPSPAPLLPLPAPRLLPTTPAATHQAVVASAVVADLRRRRGAGAGPCAWAVCLLRRAPALPHGCRYLPCAYACPDPPHTLPPPPPTAHLVQHAHDLHEARHDAQRKGAHPHRPRRDRPAPTRWLVLLAAAPGPAAALAAAAVGHHCLLLLARRLREGEQGAEGCSRAAPPRIRGAGRQASSRKHACMHKAQATAHSRHPAS